MPRALTAPSLSPRKDRDRDNDRATSAGASSRYTPPHKAIRLRPGWHKTVGFALVIVGFAIVILNILMGGGSDLTLLPGGHNELYLFLGLAMAAYSMWWFGWFDRPQ